MCNVNASGICHLTLTVADIKRSIEIHIVNPTDNHGGLK